LNSTEQLPWYRMPSNMVYIQPGTAWIGSPEDEIGHLVDEQVQKEIRIEAGFLASQNLVAQGEYNLFLAASSQPLPKGAIQLPISNILWDDAKECCRWRTRIKHQNQTLSKRWSYDLPSALQWEYMARAGSCDAFWFGNDNPPEYKTLKQQDCVAGSRFQSGPQPVAQGTPNPWGLFDLYGNVSEFCGDPARWQKLKSASTGLNKNYRMITIKGGHWESDGAECRSSYHRVWNADVPARVVGLRDVLNLSENI